MQKISWWKTNFSNEEGKRIVEALSNEHISQGPVTEQFEKLFAETLNVPYAIATTSGSVALLMAMIALDIGQGDEVIMPNRTWIATAHAAAILGANVVLVDVMPDVPILDFSQVRQKITSKTKAIVPVHLSGRCSNMEEIRQIAKEYGLFIVEDACQAFSSKNSNGYLGTQSDIGCFSLGVTKLISTAQGGMIVTHKKDIYDKLKLIRSNGTTTNITPVYSQIGCNFKFTDIQAAMGIVQLSQLQERVNRIKEIYKRYLDAIEDLFFLEVIPIKVLKGEIPLYVEVLCNERSRLMNFLKLKGIELRPFLPSLNSANYLKNFEKFPNSEIFSKQGVFLPCGPGQTIENIERVIEALREYGKETN